MSFSELFSYIIGGTTLIGLGMDLVTSLWDIFSTFYLLGFLSSVNLLIRVLICSRILP